MAIIGDILLNFYAFPSWNFLGLLVCCRACFSVQESAKKAICSRSNHKMTVLIGLTLSVAINSVIYAVELLPQELHGTAPGLNDNRYEQHYN